MKIKYKMMILLIFSSIIPALITSYIVFNKVKLSIEDVIEENERSASLKLATDAETKMKQAIKHLEHVAKSPELVSYLQKESSSKKRTIEEKFSFSLNTFYSFNAYFLSNAAGFQKVKVYKNKEIEVRFVSLRDRDYMKKALSGETALSPVIISKITNKPIINLSTPVFKDGEVVGVLSALMEVDRIVDVIQGLSFTKSSAGFFFHEDGTYLAHTNQDYILKKNFYENVQLSEKNREKILNQNEGFLNYRLNGDTYYFYFLRLKTLDWIAGYSVPGEDFYYQINQIKNYVLYTIIAIILTVILIALLLSKRITKPLYHVIDAIKEVESGNYDFVLVLKSKDERQTVVKTFNHMTASLKSETISKRLSGHMLVPN